MDYKYIEQLLERYWTAETSLEEEDILRAFFSQQDIPAELETYRSLFVYEASEQHSQPLGDDFDARIMVMTGEETQPVKAREVKLAQRLMPLFKAAAVVAIILTLGNAAQAPWDRNWGDPRMEYASYHSEDIDSMEVSPMQAENVGEQVAPDSTGVGVQAVPAY
ncbi:MAG: pyruvate ferredoxin oxidoreductase [Prevotella sp.]|nr:pyruvate ferredoxin oxidoreductase [Prevotella sp.]